VRQRIERPEYIVAGMAVAESGIHLQPKPRQTRESSERVSGVRSGRPSADILAADYAGLSYRFEIPSSFSSHQPTARCGHVRSPARLRNSSTARARPSGNNVDAIRLNAVPGPSSRDASAPADRQLSRQAAQSMVVEI